MTTHNRSEPETAMEPLRINPERLWHSLMEMARIGATPAGGCNRLTLTDADKAARDLFVILM